MSFPIIFHDTVILFTAVAYIFFVYGFIFYFIVTTTRVEWELKLLLPIKDVSFCNAVMNIFGGFSLF